MVTWSLSPSSTLAWDPLWLFWAILLALLVRTSLSSAAGAGDKPCGVTKDGKEHVLQTLGNGSGKPSQPWPPDVHHVLLCFVCAQSSINYIVTRQYCKHWATMCPNLLETLVPTVSCGIWDFLLQQLEARCSAPQIDVWRHVWLYWSLFFAMAQGPFFGCCVAFLVGRLCVTRCPIFPVEQSNKKTSISKVPSGVAVGCSTDWKMLGAGMVGLPGTGSIARMFRCLHRPNTEHLGHTALWGSAHWRCLEGILGRLLGWLNMFAPSNSNLLLLEAFMSWKLHGGAQLVTQMLQVFVFCVFGATQESWGQRCFAGGWQILPSNLLVEQLICVV